MVGERILSGEGSDRQSDWGSRRCEGMDTGICSQPFLRICCHHTMMVRDTRRMNKNEGKCKKRDRGKMVKNEGKCENGGKRRSATKDA